MPGLLLRGPEKERKLEKPSASGASALVYDVGIDHAELGFEPAGPLFERYSTGLTGRLDRRWVECYRKLTADSTPFRGFHLEPAAARVSFVCRKSDGPAGVLASMKKLEELLERANKSATAVAALGSSRAPEPEEGERTFAGALLSRIVRGGSS